METPTLVIVSGSAVTVWDCLKDDEHEHNSSSTVTFYPQGDLKVADICWNHNGQGTKEKNLYFSECHSPSGNSHVLHTRDI